jgi:hypothetical protein
VLDAKEPLIGAPLNFGPDGQESFEHKSEHRSMRAKASKRGEWRVTSIVVIAVACLVVANSTVSFAAGFTNLAVQRLWKPVADDRYLQEIGEKLQTSNAVTALAIRQGVLYLVEGATLKRLGAEKLEEVPGAPRGIQRLKCLARACPKSAIFESESSNLK